MTPSGPRAPPRTPLRDRTPPQHAPKGARRGRPYAPGSGVQARRGGCFALSHVAGRFGRSSLDFGQLEVCRSLNDASTFVDGKGGGGEMKRPTATTPVGLITGAVNSLTSCASIASLAAGEGACHERRRTP